MLVKVHKFVKTAYILPAPYDKIKRKQGGRK